MDELIDGGSARINPPLEKTVESDLDSIRVEEQFEEGGKVRYMNYYERNAKLRRAAINYYWHEM